MHGDWLLCFVTRRLVGNPSAGRSAALRLADHGPFERADLLQSDLGAPNVDRRPLKV